MITASFYPICKKETFFVDGYGIHERWVISIGMVSINALSMTYSHHYNQFIVLISNHELYQKEIKQIQQK